ncbi:hypothetical protein ACP70R_042633 [Stipagrostis hirtigluma subsp. patula]
MVEDITHELDGGVHASVDCMAVVCRGARNTFDAANQALRRDVANAGAVVPTCREGSISQSPAQKHEKRASSYRPLYTTPTGTARNFR